MTFEAGLVAPLCVARLYLLYLFSGGRDVQLGPAIHVWAQHAGGTRHGTRQQQPGDFPSRQ